MQENITKMRGAAADVFMYLYCKIPYIYVHLLTLLVKVCSFFLNFFFLCSRVYVSGTPGDGARPNFQHFFLIFFLQK